MSAQDSAYEQIRSRLLLLPREQGEFFSEVALATELGISRTPIREALLRLEAQGWLSIMPRKGAFVPPISDQEIDSVMQARFLVEEWSVTQVIDKRLDLAATLEDLLDEQAKHLTDAVEFIEVDRQFHRAIVAAGDNAVLADFYETLRDRQLRMSMRAMNSRSDRGEQVMTEHRAIVAALRDFDSIRAVDSVHRHLEATLSALHAPSRGLATSRMGKL